MNKDKSIKDLKQYNDKIKNQFEYSKIRVWNLERENDKLQQELQRKDNIIKDAKEVLLTTNNIEKALNVLDRIKELENE